MLPGIFIRTLEGKVRSTSSCLFCLLKNIFFAVPLVFLLAACGVNSAVVIEDLKEDPSAGSLIEGVPFFPQDELMCGPSALASVIDYWGKSDDMREVAESVYHEKLKGTLPVDLLIYAKEKGFEAEYYEGSLEDLKGKIRAKTPLILFLNLGHELYPIGHYVVAVGYNDKMKIILAHSSMSREDTFSYGEIMKAWGRTGFSTLLVRPKGK